MMRFWRDPKDRPKGKGTECPQQVSRVRRTDPLDSVPVFCIRIWARFGSRSCGRQGMRQNCQI